MADSTCLIYNTINHSVNNVIKGVIMSVEFNRKCFECNKDLKLIRKDRPPRYCNSACYFKKNRYIPQNFWENASWDDKILRWKKYFEMHVIRQSGCWLWNGYLSDGYGIMSAGKKLERAHRVSYMIHKGNIPKDKIVLHNCDVRSCVNPDHLRLGTHKDNADDKYKRNRDNHPHGEKHSSAKLSSNDVLKIRKDLQKEEYGMLSKLARQYDVCVSVIWTIKTKKTWRKI